MSLSFNRWRSASFLVLVLLFALAGGFSFPEIDFQGPRLAVNARYSWTTMTMTFLLGAASACLIDHKIGVVDPTSLRPFYIVLGILAMAVAIPWMLYMRIEWERILG